jgi:hypothetical protein
MSGMKGREDLIGQAQIARQIINPQPIKWSRILGPVLCVLRVGAIGLSSWMPSIQKMQMSAMKVHEHSIRLQRVSVKAV